MEKILNHFHVQIYEMYYELLNEHDDQLQVMLVQDYYLKKIDLK
jgi:hypothetical protein